MSTCNHIFEGRADGVHCTRCGLHLTAHQYHELLHPPEHPTDADKKREKERFEEVLKNTPKPTKPIDGPAATVPKRTRKKKEVNIDE